jgi:uncharacterized protein (DUF1501 family)
MNRRDFFKAGLSSVSALGAASLLGKFGEMSALAANNSSGYNALVCIFLLGGNDGHNTVIPISTNLASGQQNYSRYLQIRQGLALPQGSLNNVTMKNGDVYGLHPQLKEIQSLFTSGNAAILANVGMLSVPLVHGRQDYLGGAPVPANLFSHSDQQNQWETSVPNGFSTSGWGGRLADVYSVPAAKFPLVATTSGCGLFCSGQSTFPTTVPPSGAISLNAWSDSAVKPNAQTLLQFDNGMSLVQAANGVVSRGQNYATTLNGMINSVSLGTAFPGTQIGQQLNMVAKLIALRTQLGLNRQVFFCTLDGFDTHGNQLVDQDTLLSQLSPAIMAFYTSLGNDLGVQNQVTTFTNSEFGRTAMPNSSGGTDHAWGSHHFVVGGAVKGGDMYGTYPSLVLGGSDDANNRGTIIPTTSVAQYAATLANWFGITDPNSLAQVVPTIGNFTTQNLGFLG